MYSVVMMLFECVHHCAILARDRWSRLGSFFSLSAICGRGIVPSHDDPFSADPVDCLPSGELVSVRDGCAP